MTYEKLFNEIYAVTVLKYFWKDYGGTFVKWESPDWLNRVTDTGIEVTQALIPRDGQEECFIEKYLGKKKEELPENAFEKFGDRLYFYNGRFWALLDDESNTITAEDKILTRFRAKLAKLNTNYLRCKTNGLFIAGHCTLTEAEAENLGKQIAGLQRKETFGFDLVFLAARTALYIYEPKHNGFSAVPLPEKAVDFLEEKTAEIRKGFSDDMGAAYPG